MRSLRLGTVVLMVLLLVQLGLISCGPGDGSDENAEPATAASATSAQVSTDKALVQVLIYGLAAFKRDYDDAGRLIKISAHLPEVANPKHVFGLYRGTYTGQHGWKKVTEDDMNVPLSIEGKEIRVKMMGNLSQMKVATIGAYPEDAAAAADVGWMLRANEIDDATGFDEKYASTHVIFENGTLETCALVFNPKPWNKTCKVKVKNKKHVERSASEIMVVRGWVPKSSGAATVQIELKGLQTQTVTIPETGGDSVTWDNVTYSSVIDIAINNIYDTPGRLMMTDHGNYLKKLFPGASRSWNLEASDCRPDLQPVCWTAYFTKLFAGSPSAIDRPICPLVGSS